MCEGKSVHQIKYISENYTQNPANLPAIDTLDNQIHTRRFGMMFNTILLALMLFSFGLMFWFEGKNIRGSVFQKILTAQ